MSYIRPLVERYRVTRFAHIERRQDVYNQECIVINDVTGKSHSTHATMEGAKHSLAQLELCEKTLKKVTLKLAIS